MATSKNKKDETGTDVAVQGSTAVAASDYGDDAGGGFGNQTNADILIPFLSVLQALSPQCEDEDSTCKPGMIHNSATNEAVSGKTGILFVPAYTQHVFCEWTPRDEGGGLVAQHEPDSAAVKAAIAHSGTSFGKIRSEQGTDFVETFNVFGVECDEESALGMALISLSSTKIKPYRQWMSRLRRCTVQTANGKVIPPIFAHLTRITTVVEKRDKGTSYNIVFSAANDGDLLASLLRRDDPRFIAAKECMVLVQQGKAKAETATNEDADGGKTPF